MQALDDRLTELEMLACGKHPNEQAYIDMLKMKFATPQERIEQAAKAEELSKNRPQMAAADSMSLADALKRLAELEERERQRNLAAEHGLVKH